MAIANNTGQTMLDLRVAAPAGMALGHVPPHSGCSVTLRAATRTLTTSVA